MTPARGIGSKPRSKPRALIHAENPARLGLGLRVGRCLALDPAISSGGTRGELTSVFGTTEILRSLAQRLAHGNIRGALSTACHRLDHLLRPGPVQVGRLELPRSLRPLWPRRRAAWLPCTFI
jgi:hypothetical protein